MILGVMNHTAIRISIVAAIAASMLILGTNLAPITQQQAYAGSQSHPLQQKQFIIQNIENLCIRAEECSNSNVGQQVQGNDNSITEFADQSKNIQATVTPTPTVTPGSQTSGGSNECTITLPSGTSLFAGSLLVRLTQDVTLPCNNTMPVSFPTTIHTNNQSLPRINVLVTITPAPPGFECDGFPTKTTATSNNGARFCLRFVAG